MTDWGVNDAASSQSGPSKFIIHKYVTLKLNQNFKMMNVRSIISKLFTK